MVSKKKNAFGGTHGAALVRHFLDRTRPRHVPGTSRVVAVFFLVAFRRPRRTGDWA